MGTYREWIEKLKDQWIGEKVIFGNKQYTVIDVDYNGALLINKKARMTDTTAVGVSDINHIKVWTVFTPINGWIQNDCLNLKKFGNKKSKWNRKSRYSLVCLRNKEGRMQDESKKNG